MASKYRHYKGQSDDEDSHNYIDDESEALTLEEESQPYEYSYKDTVIDLLYSKRIFFSIIASLLALAAIPLWDLPLHVVKVSGDEFQLSSGRFVLAIAASIATALVLEYFIEKFSLRQLRVTRGSGAVWYYTNELSFFISFGITTILLHLYITFYLFNFYIKSPYDLKFYVYDILKIGLLTATILGAQRMLVKNVSMSFNYSLYINRMKKCIIFDVFINLLNYIHEAGTDVSSRDAFDQLENEQDRSRVVIGHGVPNETADKFGSFIFEKKFRIRDAEHLSMDAKRILIKEFQSMVKNILSHSGSLPTILAKVRAVAEAKGNKLVKKLVRTDRIKKFGDLKKYFNDTDTLGYMLDQLGLDPEEKIERSNMIQIIERAYKERYIISKSINQINAAIDKVALCAQACTFFFALFAMYISALENKSDIFGIVSTLFGAQFLNRIISDNVIKSILFLFVIHPFDIGDRVVIQLNATEENLVVAELNVFSTLFYRWDGTSIFVPNHILADSPICNVRRSGPTMETHSIQINTTTDPSKLYVLKQMLLEFVRNNSEIFTDYVLVNYEKIENSNKLYIKVLIQYQSNLQNYESYLKKRSFFILELNRCLRSLGITYTLPQQKISISKSAEAEIMKSVATDS